VNPEYLSESVEYVAPLFQDATVKEEPVVQISPMPDEIINEETEFDPVDLPESISLSRNLNSFGDLETSEDSLRNHEKTSGQADQPNVIENLEISPVSDVNYASHSREVSLENTSRISSLWREGSFIMLATISPLEESHWNTLNERMETVKNLMEAKAMENAIEIGSESITEPQPVPKPNDHAELETSTNLLNRDVSSTEKEIEMPSTFITPLQMYDQQINAVKDKDYPSSPSVIPDSIPPPPSFDKIGFSHWQNAEHPKLSTHETLYDSIHSYPFLAVFTCIVAFMFLCSIWLRWGSSSASSEIRDKNVTNVPHMGQLESMSRKQDSGYLDVLPDAHLAQSFEREDSSPLEEQPTQPIMSESENEDMAHQSSPNQSASLQWSVVSVFDISPTISPNSLKASHSSEGVVSNDNPDSVCGQGLDQEVEAKISNPALNQGILPLATPGDIESSPSTKKFAKVLENDEDVPVHCEEEKTMERADPLEQNHLSVLDGEMRSGSRSRRRTLADHLLRQHEVVEAGKSEESSCNTTGSVFDGDLRSSNRTRRSTLADPPVQQQEKPIETDRPKYALPFRSSLDYSNRSVRARSHSVPRSPSSEIDHETMLELLKADSDPSSDATWTLVYCPDGAYVGDMNVPGALVVSVRHRTSNKVLYSA
jgi:hypothetical protein